MGIGPMDSPKRECGGHDYQHHFSFKIHAETIQKEYAAAEQLLH